MAKKIVSTLSQSIVTEKHINEKKAARVWAKGRAQKSCKRLSHVGIHNVSRMRKLPDVGFVHESEQKKSAPKEINVLNFSSGIYFKVKFILRNINADDYRHFLVALWDCSTYVLSTPS